MAAVDAPEPILTLEGHDEISRQQSMEATAETSTHILNPEYLGLTPGPPVQPVEEERDNGQASNNPLHDEDGQGITKKRFDRGDDDDAEERKRPRLLGGD